MKTGKVSENVLKRSILRQIKTKRNEVINGAGVGADCAVLALSGTEVLLGCMQEGAVRLSVQEGGEFSVSISHLLQKCANNLAAGGGEAVAAMITLLLPQNTEEVQIKKLMAEAETACAALSMQITGGQTRVSSQVNAPFAVVACQGKARKEAYRTVKDAKPGQDIVISKWIGLEGTAILAKRHREKLLERYPAYLVEEAAGFEGLYSIVPEAATAVKSGVCAMHDASEGGIFAALWELAEGAGVGLTIDLKKLPLRQETVEVCECCNVNPYELLSGGCLIMTSEDGPALAAALQTQQIPAAVVGKITDSNDRIILNEDEVRYMDRPRTDEIYK